MEAERGATPTPPGDQRVAGLEHGPRPPVAGAVAREVARHRGEVGGQSGVSLLAALRGGDRPLVLVRQRIHTPVRRR